ncbi:hypothetical protein BGZ76_003344 [Entomortierella beljakovae]|nr:hypothetical protein BGZ76_003344 [Entomortierella beljakovae]
MHSPPVQRKSEKVRQLDMKYINQKQLDDLEIVTLHPTSVDTLLKCPYSQPVVGMTCNHGFVGRENMRRMYYPNRMMPFHRDCMAAQNMVRAAQSMLSTGIRPLDHKDHMNTVFPHPQTDINVEALENVKARLSQLQESILVLLKSINPDIPGTVPWTELHSKFNVLIAKYLHITNLVNDPRKNPLQTYTVFPNEAPANDQYVQNLSVLLRTKLFPELEQETEDRILEGAIPGLINISGGTAEDRRILQAFKLKVSMHDRLCKTADEIFEGQKDLVDPKMRYESDDDGEDEEDDTIENGEKREVTRGTLDSSSSKAKKDTLLEEDITAENLDNGSSVKYMNDWSGSLHNLDKYDSGSDIDTDEFDDDYFKARRREEVSIQSDVDLIQSDVESEDKESDDVFMTPSAENQTSNAQDASNVASAYSETFDEESSSDEEMQEVV